MRRQEKRLEFVWKPSPSLGKQVLLFFGDFCVFFFLGIFFFLLIFTFFVKTFQADIFTAVMYQHYCPPSGFSYEGENHVVDDVSNEEYNLKV